MVGACRAPPVDQLGGVARLELAKLPKCFARPGASPAMNPVRDGLRYALGIDKDVRQPVGKTVCFALESQDPGAPGEILTGLPRGVPHSLLHRCYEPGDYSIQALPFGTRSKRQCHAVFEHGFRKCEYVLNRRRKAPVNERFGTHGKH